MDQVPLKKGEEKKELIRKVQALVSSPHILGKKANRENEEEIHEGLALHYQDLNFFLYAAFTDIQLFKALWDSPQLERSLYDKQQIDFKGHKFTNWLLVLVLVQKNTELLKVFLQKQNFAYTITDFHSFVNFCLEDHH